MPELIVTIRKAVVYATLFMTIALVLGYCIAALVDFIMEGIDTVRTLAEESKK